MAGPNLIFLYQPVTRMYGQPAFMINFHWTKRGPYKRAQAYLPTKRREALPNLIIFDQMIIKIQSPWKIKMKTPKQRGLCFIYWEAWKKAHF